MWYCWKHKPKASTTLDTVWAALKAAGLAYIPILTPTLSSTSTSGIVCDMGIKNAREEDQMPSEILFEFDSIAKNIPRVIDDKKRKRKEQEGIFPLTYLRGIDGMFISIASSSERAYELFEQARDVLASLEEK